jgi:hypothetical protein
MGSRSTAPRWRVVLLAAVRLASLYAIGVALLLFPVFVGLNGPFRLLRNLTEFATPVAFGFGIAFLLLAVARRSGLIALWLLLATLWAAILRDLAHYRFAEDLAQVFVGWSTFAIPLAVLGGLGASAILRIRVGRWKPTARSVTMGLWAALLIPAVAVLFVSQSQIHPLHEAAAVRIAGDVAWFTWAPGVFLIVALSIAHVWVGTAPAKIEPPAA